MNHCNNHLKLLNSIKEMLQREREAWMNINGQDHQTDSGPMNVKPEGGGGG